MKKILSLLLLLPLLGLSQVKVTVTPDNSSIPALQTAVGLKADKAGDTFAGPVYVPTAASGTNNTQAASTAFAWNEARQRDLPRAYYDSLMGSTIKAQNVDAFYLTTVKNSASLVNQRMFFSVVGLYRSDTITGAKWRQVLQGNYTSTDYNGIAVYSLSKTGTATLLASSTNDGNIWKAADNTVGSKAFSSSVVLSKGVYVVAILFCRTGSPSVVPTLGYLGYASATSNVTDYTGSIITSGYIDGQTSMPSSFNMSSATFNTNQFWFGLYK